MLAELRVRDVATIADATLQLGPGLNVLTGETGAGKSMLVDALGLLLGGRSDSQAVRPGAGRAVVEGAFEGLDRALLRRIEALGLDAEDGRVVIRREVSTEGRSRAWVNGSPTTVAVLTALGALLVDLHGQQETVSLLRPDTQRDILDAYAAADGERASVEQAHAALAGLREQEASLASRREEVRRRADYLRHVVQEIGAARLEPGESESLAAEAMRLTHAGRSRNTPGRWRRRWTARKPARCTRSRRRSGRSVNWSGSIRRSPPGPSCLMAPTRISRSWRVSRRRMPRASSGTPRGSNRSSDGATCCIA
jgi:DNA repair protein RecN (Recombination protein N)